MPLLSACSRGARLPVHCAPVSSLMPRKQPSKAEKDTHKEAEILGKGKVGEVGEKPPKDKEEPKASKSPGSETRSNAHTGHMHKSSKKGHSDPNAAAIKVYSPFLNTVFGKVCHGHWGGAGQGMHQDRDLRGIWALQGEWMVWGAVQVGEAVGILAGIMVPVGGLLGCSGAALWGTCG